MTMHKGQRYRCQNRECGAEIEVMKDSIEEESNPRCCCGAEMKKPYSKPVFTILDKDDKGKGVLQELFRKRAS